MPEGGHSVHRLARQFQDVFGGRCLDVSSPQGRFAAGAELLTGHTMVEATAHGKQLFLRFDHELFLHVHLGLYGGAWSFGGDSSFTGASSIGAPRRIGEREAGPSSDDGDYAGPPPPVARCVSGWCPGTAGRISVVPPPVPPSLRPRQPPCWRGWARIHCTIAGGDREEFIRRLRRRKTAVALLLMDQSVLAGVGNIYRAEVLFRQAVDPWTPGSSIDAETAGRLWDDTVDTMSDGVRDGRIVTTPPRRCGPAVVL